MICLLPIACVLICQQSSEATTAFPPDREMAMGIITCGPGFDISYAPGQGAMPGVGQLLGGPSKGITVFPQSQVLQYISHVDMARAAQQEPQISFWRCFRSDLALKGESSPGMPAGWITNYDMHVEIPKDDTKWRRMKLVYPNGAKTDLVPMLDVNGAPSGEFQHANGDPFVIRGVPGKTVNSWASIEYIRSECRLIFGPAKDGVVRLATVRPPVGDVLAANFYYDDQGRLTGISSGKTNLWIATLNYGTNGYLDSIVLDHKNYVRFNYEQNQDALKGQWVLRSVSNNVTDPKNEELYYFYNYKIINGHFLLSAISRPSASLKSDAWTTAKIQYSAEGRVEKLTDANGNTTTITAH